MNNLQWFKKRIGKVIYRDADGCDCSECEKIIKNGLTIHDENHAQYVFDTQNDFGAEGIVLNYRDEK